MTESLELGVKRLMRVDGERERAKVRDDRKGGGGGGGERQGRAQWLERDAVTRGREGSDRRRRVEKGVAERGAVGGGRRLPRLK